MGPTLCNASQRYVEVLEVHEEALIKAIESLPIVIARHQETATTQLDPLADCTKGRITVLITFIKVSESSQSHQRR